MPADEGASTHGIAMWGPSGSGKTTFLGALSIALLRSGTTWRLAGENSESEEKLIELTTGLATKRAFPPRTAEIGHYRWALSRRVSRLVRQGWLGRRPREQDVVISLDLVDTPGELAGPNGWQLPSRTDLIDDLERSEGIVFLFDPIGESERGDAFDHTFGVLLQLAQRVSPASGARLPHWVAVCVTKFDEIRVLTTAEKLGLIAYDQENHWFPRVPDEDARELFIQLCEVAGNSDADMVPRTLEQYFQPDRIKYFVTSAIGFYVDPLTGVFNSDDYQNVVPDPDGRPRARIRGSLYPINVMEPLLWLSERLTKEP